MLKYILHMPINVEYILPGAEGDQPIYLGQTAPGMLAVAVNHGTDPHIVGWYCYPGDNGGYVNRYELSSSDGLIDADEFLLDTDAGLLEAPIEDGGTYRRPFTTTAAIGTLVLTHVRKQ
jgi:hypothetical protein